VVEGSGLERRPRLFPQNPVESVSFPLPLVDDLGGVRLSPPESLPGVYVSPQNSPQDRNEGLSDA
jgi:hypothetical protein